MISLSTFWYSIKLAVIKMQEISAVSIQLLYQRVKHVKKYMCFIYLQYDRDVEDFLRRTTGLSSSRSRDHDRDRSRERDREREHRHRERDGERERHRERHRERRWYSCHEFVLQTFIHIHVYNIFESGTEWVRLHVMFAVVFILHAS